jgi:hypothetical protein
LTGGLLIVSEFLIGGVYLKNLYKKMPEEIFEDIPGIKIAQTNAQEYRHVYGQKSQKPQHSRMYVLKMNVKDAA